MRKTWEIAGSLTSPKVGQRGQMILYEIVDSYIDNDEPVGSRGLAKLLDLDLSPSTIRNIMTDLSEMGYLMQSHSASGRIPTNKAYRFYLDSLVEVDRLPSPVQERIRTTIHKQTGAIGESLKNTATVLSELTQCVAFTTAPLAEKSLLNRITFIKVNAHRTLAVLITKSGFIFNKILFSSENFSQNFLISIADILNEEFENKTLQEISDKILPNLVARKECNGHLIAQAIRLGKKVFAFEDLPEIYMAGQYNLFMNSRLKTKSVLKTLFDRQEQKRVLMKIVKNTLQSQEIRVLIGKESQCEELHECSLILAKFTDGNEALGTVGIIGPISMDYRWMIPMVECAAKTISQQMKTEAQAA